MPMKNILILKALLKHPLIHTGRGGKLFSTLTMCPKFWTQKNMVTALFFEALERMEGLCSGGKFFTILLL